MRAMEGGLAHDFASKANQPCSDQPLVEDNKVRTGQAANGDSCGVFTATDPDEGRTRGTIR